MLCIAFKIIWLSISWSSMGTILTITRTVCVDFRSSMSSCLLFGRDSSTFATNPLVLLFQLLSLLSEYCGICVEFRPFYSLSWLWQCRLRIRRGKYSPAFLFLGFRQKSHSGYMILKLEVHSKRFRVNAFHAFYTFFVCYDSTLHATLFTRQYLFWSAVNKIVQ